MGSRMSAILFRRFLARPLQVAYVLPSSKGLVRRVLDKMDFAKARVFVEFGAGEGCYTRELAKRLAPDAKLRLRVGQPFGRAFARAVSGR